MHLGDGPYILIQGRRWGRIFILDSVYVSQKSPSDPRLIFPENKEISAPPPCGFLIGIYLFYENWSTETFRNKESKKRAPCNTYYCGEYLFAKVIDLRLKE